jgi:ribosomal protein S18 acetylase RimI-like enzyme
MKQSSRLIAALITGCTIVGAGFWYYRYTSTRSPLVDFVYERDMPEIVQIIDENWYWLFPESKETYPAGYVDYVFKYRAPQANVLQHGKLTIKVLRINNRVAGFVAYHMRGKQSGMLLYLAVKHEYRGKQYGEAMARLAIQELVKRGATIINLLTRADNIPAQRIYTKLGFHEVLNDGEGFVYFAYEPGAATS